LMIHFRPNTSGFPTLSSLWIWILRILWLFIIQVKSIWMEIVLSTFKLDAFGDLQIWGSG
jgi:hypothetical protein